MSTPNTETTAAATAGTDATVFTRIESFIAKAKAELEVWLHHPAAANATGHLNSALDHVAEGKAAASTNATAAAAGASDTTAATTTEAGTAAGATESEAVQQ